MGDNVSAVCSWKVFATDGIAPRRWSSLTEIDQVQNPNPCTPSIHCLAGVRQLALGLDCDGLGHASA